MKRYFALVIIASLAFASACSKKDSEVTAATRPISLKTAPVQLQSVQDVLEIAARVQPDPARVVRVYPPAGGRLLRVEVRPGDQIAKGRVVAVLESSDVAQARTDYDKARIEADRSNRALTRTKLLFEHKVASEREYQEAEAAQLQAKSELDRTISRLKVLGASPQTVSNEVAVVSPLAGTVIDLGASTGELSKSTDNANPLCTVADLTTVWVVGDVFEKDLSAVHVGSPVEITVSAYSNEKWNGKVAAVSDAVDPQTRTLKVRIVLQNPVRKLKPDMFASIRIRRELPAALVIPSSAVLREGGDTAVMVQTDNAKYERRLVTVKTLNEKESIAVAGLRQGELVVTEGAALLRGEGEQ